MLFVILHINKNEKDRSDSYHGKQVNNVITTLFCGLSMDKVAVTQYLFFTDNTGFDNKNGSFYGDEFI